jgi:hypothetical protein
MRTVVPNGIAERVATIPCLVSMPLAVRPDWQYAVT